MKIQSVNRGHSTLFTTSRGAEPTGFFKKLTAGPVHLMAAGLEGDFIGWPKGHGPPARVVYCTGQSWNVLRHDLFKASSDR